MNSSSNNTTEVLLIRWGDGRLASCAGRGTPTHTCTSMHQLSHCKLLKHTLHDLGHVSGFTFLCALLDIRRKGLCEDG